MVDDTPVLLKLAIGANMVAMFVVYAALPPLSWGRTLTIQARRVRRPARRRPPAVPDPGPGVFMDLDLCRGGGSDAGVPGPDRLLPDRRARRFCPAAAARRRGSLGAVPGAAGHHSVRRTHDACLRPPDRDRPAAAQRPERAGRTCRCGGAEQGGPGHARHPGPFAHRHRRQGRTRGPADRDRSGEGRCGGRRSWRTWPAALWRMSGPQSAVTAA